MGKKRKILGIACLAWICLFARSVDVWAEKGRTTLAVSANTIAVGETVTVTAKAFTDSWGGATASMTLTFDSSVFAFVSCDAAGYEAAGNSVTASGANFNVKLKAVSEGTGTVSLKASGGKNSATGGGLEAVEGSSTKIAVKSAQDAQLANLSADNSLKTLTLSAGTLSPQFAGNVVKYTASVPGDVTSVDVTAVPVNAKASVESITGNTDLAVGENTIEVTVKAENGAVAVYRILLTRADAAMPEVVTEEPAPAEAEPEGASDPEGTDEPSEEPAPAEAEPEGASDPEGIDGSLEEPEILPEDDGMGDDYAYEQLSLDYEALRIKYREDTNSLRGVIMWLIFALAVAVIIIVNLLIFGLRRRREEAECDLGGEERGRRAVFRRRSVEEQAGDTGRIPVDRKASAKKAEPAKRSAEIMEPKEEAEPEEKKKEIDIIDFND